MIHINNRLVLLMTGTIIPNSLDTLVLTNPEHRKKQYIDAIHYYLRNTNFKIVFVENSGVTIKEFFKGHEDRLEFLTFNSPPSVPDKGKGFKELEIMSFGMDNSKFVANCFALVKITGRLKILNLKPLSKYYYLKLIKKQCLISCNVYKKSKMDSRCFFYSKDFWPYLKSKKINLTYSFEQALWDSVIDYKKNQKNHSHLKSPLRVEGVSGGFGTLYDDSFMVSFMKKIKYLYLRYFVFNNIDAV